MKKALMILIAVIMIISCTGCSLLSKGDVETQEKVVIDYVTKFFGEGTVTKKIHTLLDVNSTFTIKDKRDGFEYKVSVFQAPLSDFGFKDADGNALDNEYTYIMNNDFAQMYLYNIMEKKIDKQTVIDFSTNKKIKVVPYSSTITAFDVIETSSTSHVFFAETGNLDDVAELASIIKKSDDRNALSSLSIAIYKEENHPPIGYYNFFFDKIFTPDEQAPISLLHDYLQNQGITSAKIESINLKRNVSDLPLKDGFTWADNDVETCKTITYTVDGKTYEAALLSADSDNENVHILGYDSTLDTPDDYGICKGSFIDIIGSERSGGRVFYISYYATLYPENYGKLSLYVHPVTPGKEAE